MKLNKNKLVEAYKGKNVFITGITGFKGSWAALVLHSLGANVYGMGLKPEERNSIFYQADIQKIAKVQFGDITESALTSKLLSGIFDCCPDYIFHMAAQPIVSKGYEDPFGTFHTNIMGTVILHEILRGLEFKPGCKTDKTFTTCKNSEAKRISVINVTTDKVYKENNRPSLENDEMFGFDPYSLSKTCSDMISTCYRDALKSNHFISTMRAGNVIGGGDMSENRIVPDIVRSAISKQSLEVRSPNSVRPYQHVFDAITGYLWIALLQKENEELQDAYNIGPDIEQTMTTKELVERMNKEIPFEYELNGKSIGKESSYLALDNSKIKNTGWVPAFNNNEKVVKATSEWYNNFINGEDMQEFTLKQIEEAFESVKN